MDVDAEWTAGSYGDAFADVYDDWYAEPDSTPDCVAALASRAGTGPVLELGVGTGRLALPLARRGLDVRGIEASAAMVHRLRSKPDGDAVAVAQGDLVTADPPRRRGDGPDLCFSLVFASYNTLFNVADDAGQRTCLHRVRRWLDDDGWLAVEAFVPDLDPDGAARPVVHRLSSDRLVLSAAVVDEGAQTIAGQFVDITEAGIRLRPWRIRYLRPDQLDDRAAEAGLTLHERWEDWRGTPFGRASQRHVSWYRVTGRRSGRRR